MKERIVIEDFSCPDNCKRKDCEVCFKERSKKEQVPETFEELKELCKNIKGCYIGENYINLSEKWLSFLNDGQIICHFYFITNNATPQQMWQIIKSLIGEE